MSVRQTVTTVAELDALPEHSVVASLGRMLDVPLVAVWQRGSINGGQDGLWCMPDKEGGITSSEVFQFLIDRGLIPELTVLWEQGELLDILSA